MENSENLTQRDNSINQKNFRPPLLNKRSKLLLSLLVPLILAVTGFYVNSATQKNNFDIRNRAANNPVSISFVPGTLGNYNVGDTVSLGIELNTGDQTVSAAELHLTYDQTKLQAQNIIAGSYLPVVLQAGSVGAGNASIILGSQPSGPQKGTGIIATLTFKTLAAGASQVSFSPQTQVAAIG